MPTVQGHRPRGTGAIDQVEQVEPVRRPARPPAEPSGLERLIVAPDIGGPRVRVGVLWFLLMLAAVTAGRWWAAVLCSFVAAAGGYQMARSWAIARAEAGSDDGVAPIGAGRIPALLAGLLAASVPLAAGYGTGMAGASLIVAATVAGLVSLAGRATGATVALASLPAGIAASSIVLALQVDLWVATFLVLAVSLYDAGSFLLGADAAGRWEGPLGGAVGVFAVTFTVATIQVPPLDRAEWWILGVLIAVTAMFGQWAATWCMAAPTASVPALRRLDAYLVAGPVVVGAAWLLTA